MCADPLRRKLNGGDQFLGSAALGMSPKYVVNRMPVVDGLVEDQLATALRVNG